MTPTKIPRRMGMLTTTEAAARLGMSVRTFWRLVHRLRIRPALTIGTAYLYTLAAIDRLQEGRSR